MGISEIYSGQAAKENSPTSGLLGFLVARGGIDQDLRISNLWLVLKILYRAAKIEILIVFFSTKNDH